MNIGDFIKKRQLELNLSQRKLGKISGVNFVQINKYENGKAKPSQRILEKLLPKLNIELDYVLQINGTKIPDLLFESALETAKSPELSEEDRTAIYWVIHQIVSKKAANKLVACT